MKISGADAMEESFKINHYPPLEEKINIYSHLAGLVLGLIGTVLLLNRASLQGDTLRVVSFAVFGFSLMFLYAASALYHSARNPARRNRLRIVDHASIYVLIAGTYTPFALLALQGVIGWVIFGVSWALALTGIVLKLYFTGRFHRTSTAMYVLMGWIIIFAIKPLMQNLSSEGLFWLVCGGVSYTLGALLYSIGRIKFNHAIFHILVLLGSASHFLSVYFYV